MKHFLEVGYSIIRDPNSLLDMFRNRLATSDKLEGVNLGAQSANLLCCE